MRNVIRAGAAAVMSMVVLAAGVLPSAEADDADARAGIEPGMIEFFDAYGVPVEARVALVDKMRRGEQWDSVTGAEPVSVKVSHVPGKEPIVVATYPDGSVMGTYIVDRPNLTQSGIQKCSTEGSGVQRIKRNCQVWASNFFMTMQFTATYKYTYASMSDPWVRSASITKVSNPKIVGVDTISNKKLSITRSVAAKGAPAKARLSFKGYILDDILPVTYVLDLIVPIGGYELAYTKART